jgi:hypothetical protein
MIRRISTKLLIAVLAAVVIPFLGFAVFVDLEMAERLSRGVVLDSLKGLAIDLASQLDRDLEGRALDAQLWAGSRTCEQAIDERDLELAGRQPGTMARQRQGETLDEILLWKHEFDLLLLVNSKGRFVVSNTLDANGELLPDDVWRRLESRDWSQEKWFEAAMAGETVGIEWGPTQYLPLRNADPGVHAENYEFGYAVPVRRKALMPFRRGRPGRAAERTPDRRDARADQLEARAGPDPPAGAQDLLPGPRRRGRPAVGLCVDLEPRRRHDHRARARGALREERLERPQVCRR